MKTPENSVKAEGVDADVPMLDSELVVLDEANDVPTLNPDFLVAEDDVSQSPGSRPTQPRSGRTIGHSKTVPSEATGLRGMQPKAVIQDRYEIMRALEAGGMGQVFVVLDRRTEQICALKIGLDPDPRGDYHLKREFRSVKHIRHRNLVKLYELGFDRPRMMLYYTMELIDGTTFIDYVRRTDDTEDGWIRVDVARLRYALAQLTDGIQALHAHERLHRDLKPSNVMVSTADERVVILDFGLVDYTDHNEVTLSHEGPVGTPQYMAPEQTIHSRGCTPATDWYAVGVMIFEAVTGQLPISGRTMFELLTNKQLSTPPRMSEVVRGVPPSLDELVAGLLSREPSERPNAAALRAWCRAREVLSEVEAKFDTPGTTVLLGRGTAVSTICHAYNQVLAKKPQTVMVHGPSGTGKSALIRHVLRSIEVSQPEILVLRGTCYEHEMVPYRAFDQVIEGLARYLVSRTAEHRAALIPARMSHLLDLFPVLRRVPGIERGRSEEQGDEPQKNQQEQRRWAFYELKHLLFNVASEVRLVVVLDDLHLSDGDSAHLLSEILSPPYQPPMLLIGAYRSQATEEAPFLLDFLNLIKTADLQSIRFLELGPLAHADAVRVAAQLLSAHGIYRPEYAETLARTCAGNSALMEQVTDLIVADLSGFSSEEKRLGEEAFSLARLVARRLANMSEGARLVVESLAVAGAPLATPLLKQIVDLDGPVLGFLDQLTDANLVYIHERDGATYGCCFNSLVRDAVIERLPAERVREIHRRLANAFIEDLPGSAKACAFHLIAAGNEKEAVEFLEMAALAARSALAFEQAAELYRVALRCSPGLHHLELKLAEALELAGNFTESSRYLLAAASRASSRRQIELTGRAASQMLICGDLTGGLETLAQLLPMIDIDLPVGEADISKAFRRAITLLKIHPLTFFENTRFQISSQLLLRIDTTWLAGRGLLLVDPTLAGYLISHSAQLALAAGEPRRIARALAVAGMLMVNRDAESGYHVLARAEEVSHGIGDQYAIGLSAICIGLAKRSEGQWAEALTKLNFGVEHLRSHAIGVAWEQSLALTGTFSTLEALGDFPTLEARIPGLLRQAEVNGDMHTSLLATLYSGLLLLARDRVNDADIRICDALSRWRRLDRYLAHMHALKLSAYIDLYRDQPGRAWERITKLPTDVVADHAQYLSFRVGRNDWHVLRGRTALARARTAQNAPALLKHCARIARVLARQPYLHAQGASEALRAGVANLGGFEQDTLRHLKQAENYFNAAGMALHVACVQRRFGVLVGGTQGQEIIAEADHTFARVGVKNPEKWVRIYTPGLAPEDRLC